MLADAVYTASATNHILQCVWALILNLLNGRLIMQATKPSNKIMFSPIQHHTGAIHLLQRAAQKLKASDNIIDILEYLIPPNDEDSSCFVKSSN